MSLSLSFEAAAEDLFYRAGTYSALMLLSELPPGCHPRLHALSSLDARWTLYSACALSSRELGPGMDVSQALHLLLLPQSTF